MPDGNYKSEIPADIIPNQLPQKAWWRKWVDWALFLWAMVGFIAILKIVPMIQALE